MPHLDGATSVLQFCFTFGVVFHQVSANAVLHNAVAGNTILIELHFYRRLFACLVEPVGMVGHRQPEVVAAVRIILYCPCSNRQHKTGKRKD